MVLFLDVLSQDDPGELLYPKQSSRFHVNLEISISTFCFEGFAFRIKMRSLQLYSLLLLLSLTGYTAGGSTPSGSTKSKHTPSHMPSSSHTSHVAASGSASTLSHSTGLNTSMASSHHPTHSTVSPHPSHNSNRKSSLWPASGFKRTTPASVRVSSDGTSHLVPKGTGHFSSGTYHHRGTGSMRPTGHSTRSRGNLYSGMSGHAPSHTGNATRYASSSYRPRPTGSATKMQNSTSHHTTSSVMGTWKSGDCKLSYVILKMIARHE